MAAEAATDYTQLKVEVLVRSGMITTTRAQGFHDWRYQDSKALRSQLFDLIHLIRKWLCPEIHNTEIIIEVLVLDGFMRGLSSELRGWVSQNDCFCYEDLVALVKRHFNGQETFSDYRGRDAVDQEASPHPEGPDS